MHLLLLVLACAVTLTAAYWTGGPLLSRLLRLDASTATPAHRFRDGVDYSPLERGSLLSQHFSAIAAAGPIVGPILAGALFGWLPALIWILVGAVFIGGVHDMTALVASIRHRARSVAEVTREHMSHRSFVLLLIFVWLALVYIIVAFADITASSFVGTLTLENGQVVRGAGIATSSLLYLLLPVAMGFLVRRTGMSMSRAAVLFLPVVAAAIWGGQRIPLDLAAAIQSLSPQLSLQQSEAIAHRGWDVALLAYCGVASVVPLWALLQPRGQLGGWFLYAALFGGAIGVMLGNEPVRFPAFTGWTAASGETLFPVLFITVACGACSGFHSLIASGTTSKQLRRETDARLIGYGAMLLEAMVAIVSLCCLMMLPPASELARSARPNLIYAQGIGRFLEVLQIPPALGVAFALMAFTTFVYDTLDVCTRLGRYVVQELTGWHDRRGKWAGTLLTAGAPLLFIFQTATDPSGRPIPIWRLFWSLFGASNQLLAALTLLTVTVWLWRTRRAPWVWFVTGVPTAWMYVMSTWGLLGIIRSHWVGGQLDSPVLWVAALLVLLAAAMLYEAIRAVVETFRRPTRPADAVQPVSA